MIRTIIVAAVLALAADAAAESVPKNCDAPFVRIRTVYVPVNIFYALEQRNALRRAYTTTKIVEKKVYVKAKTRRKRRK